MEGKRAAGERRDCWVWQANGHGLLVFGRRDWVQAGEQARRDGPGLDGHAGVAVVGCVLQGPGMAGVGRLVHCRCSIGRAWQGSAMT